MTLVACGMKDNEPAQHRASAGQTSTNYSMPAGAQEISICRWVESERSGKACTGEPFRSSNANGRCFEWHSRSLFDCKSKWQVRN